MPMGMCRPVQVLSNVGKRERSTRLTEPLKASVARGYDLSVRVEQVGGRDVRDSAYDAYEATSPHSATLCQTLVPSRLTSRTSGSLAHRALFPLR